MFRNLMSMHLLFFVLLSTGIQLPSASAQGQVGAKQLDNWLAAHTTLSDKTAFNAIHQPSEQDPDDDPTLAGRIDEHPPTPSSADSSVVADRSTARTYSPRQARAPPFAR